MSLAYLNGTFLPLEDAKVSALDRGFLFGDGIYEVIPVFNRHLFRLDKHMDRLRHSLMSIHLNLEPKLDNTTWREIFTRLIESNDAADQGIYLQITRGSDIARSHTIPENLTPTIFAFSQTIKPLPVEELQKGIKAITVDDIRWGRCDIKSIALLPNILLYQQAQEAGAQEALLIRDGHMVEGSSSNLFIVHGGNILTPPPNQHLLGGITRELILELAKKMKIPFQECDIKPEDLFAADEIWISSSTREIRPVIQLDEKVIGNGHAGPIWEKIIRAYQAFKINVSATDE